ncbi:MAG: LysR family transcriptional regulator [Burkholderiaceae bacterium]
MNLRQLEIFEAVMRTGSVSQAARALSISQPAISKSLRLAEQAAGFVLFRRVHGRLFPSPEAEALLPQVERVRSDLGAVSLLIRQLHDGNAGSITVAAVPSIAHAFLTPAVAAFSRERPNIRLEMLVLPTNLVADRVAHSQADFGLVYQPTDNPYLDGDVVCQAECVCIMPNRHPLARRKTVNARDLQKSRLICYREDTDIGWLFRRALSAAGDRRDVDLVVNQAQQALDLVEAGAGVAVIDPFVLVGQPARPSLTALPFRPMIPNRLRIIRARERPRSRAAAHLERMVRNSILKLVRESPLIPSPRGARAGDAVGAAAGTTATPKRRRRATDP